MIARHHVVFAASSFAATAVGLQTTDALPPLRPGPFAALVGVACGAALLPDLDEPRSAAGRSLGLVTSSASRLIRWAAQGHRGVTHTIPAAGAVFLLALLACSHAAVLPWLLGGLVWLGCGVARTDKVIRRLLGPIPPLLPLAAAGAVWWLSPTLVGTAWPAVAVGVGWLSHMVGDTMTPHGVPWCWPLRPVESTVSWGWFRTGSAVEPLVTWALVVGLVGCAARFG